VTNKSTHKIKTYIKKDLYDIVSSDWLQKCIDSERLHPWKPSDMLHAKQATRERFSKLYDVYGDSFYDDVDLQTLKKIFSGMDPRETSKGEDMTDEEVRYEMKESIYDFENKFYPDESFECGLFRLCVFYFDAHEVLGEEKKLDTRFDLLEAKVKWQGAFVLEKITDKVTHCIVDKT
jgi:hypothetical protein